MYAHHLSYILIHGSPNYVLLNNKHIIDFFLILHNNLISRKIKGTNSLT